MGQQEESRGPAVGGWAMAGFTTGGSGPGGGGEPGGSGGASAGGSWLAGLFRPGGPKGRLKGNTLKLLVFTGVLVLFGMALMGLGDMLWPRANPVPGTVAVGPGSLVSGSGSSPGVADAGLGSAPSGGPSGQGYWISVADLEAMIERTLERILSQIQGAGRVSVAVSLDAGATYVYGYDETQTSETTEEHDANGGSRVVTQTNTTKAAVVVNQGASSQPVVVRVDLPPIQGVVVVASGANDSRVKALLAQAVQTLYGVPAHRVIVLAGG